MSLRVVVVVLVAVAVDHERARTNTHAVYPRRFFGLSLLEKKARNVLETGKLFPLALVLHPESWVVRLVF